MTITGTTQVKPACSIFFFLLIFFSLTAQEKKSGYNNRLNIGTGGENSVIGADYSRNIWQLRLFAGAGLGSAGPTAYVRYEFTDWHGIIPFLTSGFSYSYSGTISVSPETSVFHGWVG